MRKTHNGSPGLWTAPNSELSPPGALKQATGTAIKRAGVIEARRPFEQIAVNSDFASGVSSPNTMFEYNAALYVTGGTGTSRIYYNPNGLNGGAAWTAITSSLDIGQFGLYGSFEANRCCYDGVYKLDADGGTPYLMGVPRALDVQLSAAGGTGSLLAITNSVAYRIVFGIKDAKSNLVLGPPSGRATYTATGVQNVVVKAWIPTGIYSAANATSYFYQVYRTGVQTVVADPGEEMQLVYQAYLTASDIAAKFVSFTDATPDGLRGAALYTNPSQEGIAQGNFQPPTSKAVAYFKTQAFYGNTTSKHRARLQMLGTAPVYTITTAAGGFTKSGGSGIVTLTGGPDLTGIPTDGTAYISISGATTPANNGDFPITAIVAATSITYTNAAAVTEAGAAAARCVATKLIIAGSNYYASLVAENTTTPYRYLVTTTGTTSTTVDAAAKSLLRVVNQTNANAYGFYESGPDDGAGKMLFEEQSIGGSAFTITAAGLVFANGFAPAIQTASGIASQNDAAVNRLYFSKPGQPEHVPLANYFDIGDSNKAILALVRLRESLLVFKTDGLFRVASDGAGNVTVAPLDGTLQLLNANGSNGTAVLVSAVALANRCYAITTKGIVSVTDSGAVGVIGHPVADKVASAIEYSSSRTNRLLASEMDGVLYAYAPTGTNLSYGVNSQAWTGFGTLPAQNGFVASNGRLYVVRADGVGGVWREAWMDADGIGIDTSGAPIPGDRYLITTGAVISGGTVTVSITAYVGSPFATSGLTGYAFSSNGSFATVLSDPGGGLTRTLTLSSATGAPSAGARNLIYAPASKTIEWVPYTAGDDGAGARFREVSILLDGASTLTTATVSMYTEATTLTPVAFFTPANSPLPVGVGGLTLLRCLVPPNMQKARRLSVVLTHNTVGEFVFVRGISYEFQTIDGREVT